MKRSTKVIVSSGLLASIGFLTSFNPNSMLIGKNRIDTELSEREFASTTPKFTEIELGEFDKSLQGVRMKVALNTERNRAVYNLEGDICTPCVGIQEVAIPEKDIENLEFLKRLLAKSAMEQIKETNAKRRNNSNRFETPPSASAPSESQSQCEMELEDGLLNCQKDEFLGRISKCEDTKEKSTCYREAERFFNRNLRRTLSKGLSSTLSSDLFVEASEIRDDLLTDLPSRFDNSIRRLLIASTSDGVKARLYQTYTMKLMTGGSPGFAATVAKAQMANEINHQNRFSVGGQLFQTLMAYSEDSRSLDSLAAHSLFIQNFYLPLHQLWMQDHSRGLNSQVLPNIISQENTFDQIITTPSADLSPTTPPGLQMPEGLAQRRANPTSTRSKTRIVNPNLTRNQLDPHPLGGQPWNQSVASPHGIQHPAQLNRSQGRIGGNQFFNQGNITEQPAGRQSIRE